MCKTPHHNAGNAMDGGFFLLKKVVVDTFKVVR